MFVVNSIVTEGLDGESTNPLFSSGTGILKSSVKLVVINPSVMMIVSSLPGKEIGMERTYVKVNSSRQETLPWSSFANETTWCAPNTLKQRSG